MTSLGGRSAVPCSSAPCRSWFPARSSDDFFCTHLSESITFNNMRPTSPPAGQAVQCSLDATRCVDRTATDILLPERIVRYAIRLSLRYGEWRDLIRYLVWRHRKRILDLAKEGKHLGFCYQSGGLSLKRVSYLPYVDTRAELRMLSYAARISMCALVVLMLEWERESADHSVKVPGVPMDLESGWHLAGGLLIIKARIHARATHPPPGV